MKIITTVGPHRVKHGNVMVGIEELMGNDTAEIVYSDPPWGEGNIKYWETMNKKMNNVETKSAVPLPAFLNQIFSIATKYSNNMILIEYGMKWCDDIKEYGAKHGLIHNGIAILKYRSGSKFYPLHLHIFSKKEIVLPSNYLESLRDTFGMDTLRRAIEPFKKSGKIILDPCCGMGYTAQIALETGMFFRGNELNEARLTKTIARLQKHS